MATAKVALIVGASRGIGKQLALSYAASGYDVVISAKTLHKGDAKLPGSLDEVKQAIQAQPGPATAHAVECDVRSDEQVESMVASALDRFGRLDSVVYNPGAIYWDTVENTSVKRLDLMYEVNLRGAFALSRCVLPTLRAQNAGTVTFVAPPIYSRFIRGKTAYATTKMGLTILALGLAHELQGTNIVANAMWPATAIESAVTQQMRVPRAVMRSPHIFADACVRLSELDPASAPRGEALLDEDFLRTQGWSDADFVQYRCDPELEPPRMMPAVLPDLTVAEEEEQLSMGTRASAAASRAGLRAGRPGKSTSKL